MLGWKLYRSGRPVIHYQSHAVLRAKSLLKSTEPPKYLLKFPDFVHRAGHDPSSTLSQIANPLSEERIFHLASMPTFFDE